MRSILPTVAFAALWLSGAISLLATDVPARTVAIVADKDNRFKLADGKGPLVLKSGEKVTFRITAVFGGEKARAAQFRCSQVARPGLGRSAEGRRSRVYSDCAASRRVPD